MWQDRISFEALTSYRPSTFLTLTFDDKHYHRSCDVKDIQGYAKRLRYYLSKYRTSADVDKVRYFAVSEYGEERYRLHYHWCITNLDCYNQRDFDSLYRAWLDKDKNPIGILTADGLLPARIRYCVKYINNDTLNMLKVYDVLNLKRPIHTMSKGIGADWLFAHADELRASNGYWQHGKLRPLPRYYAEKLGMIETNAYLKDLPNIWQKYNEILESKNIAPVNPFDVKDAIKRGLLDQNSPESKRTVLQTLIGNEAKELAQMSKILLLNDSERRLA